MGFLLQNLFELCSKLKVMKTTVLLTQFIPEEGLVELRSQCNVIMPKSGSFTIEEQHTLIPDADILLSLFSSPVNRDLLAAGKKLRMISNFGVGYNNIDLEYAKERGIVVTNTPDQVTLPTAEHTLGLMLALTRRIAETDRNLRLGKIIDWKVMSNLGHTLNHKTLGIIGMGKIGQATTKLANAFGMKVIYYSRNKIDEQREKELHTAWVPKDELLAVSDVVSIHVPLTAETRYLMDKQALVKMKPSAILINTARGPIVNEEDLVDALKSNQIAGAALDVFENEPSIHPELLNLDQVVLTPHIGTGTIETRIETAQVAADHILAFLCGEPLVNRVI